MENMGLGTAVYVEYLRQGCAQLDLHFHFKPKNIMLDQNFQSQNSDYGYDWGTIGYIAPKL